MESPVPDLFYYQRIVENESLSEGSVRYELQELIHEVKTYLGFIAKERNRLHKEFNEEILKRITIPNECSHNKMLFENSNICSDCGAIITKDHSE